MRKSKKIARYVELKERIRDQKKRERLALLNQLAFQRKKEKEVVETQSELASSIDQNRFNINKSFQETIQLLELSAQEKQTTKKQIEQLMEQDEKAMQELSWAQMQVKKMGIVHQKAVQEESKQEKQLQRKQEDEAAMIQRSRHENR